MIWPKINFSEKLIFKNLCNVSLKKWNRYHKMQENRRNFRRMKEIIQNCWQGQSRAA